MWHSEKVYRYGERGSGTKTKDGIPQYYEDIVQKCFEEDRFFDDPEFPCDDSSICIKKRKGDIVWKRPHEIVENPRFFVEGVSMNDVCQMTVGNCWFVAALASLTQRKVLFDRVVPRGQRFERGSYAGVFHFVFCKENRWVDVVIDDRLPMFKEGGYLSVKSGDENEFWASLVEKAYAKLYGSYGALVGGRGNEAMCDLTGGIPERIFGIPLPKDTWHIMKRAFERKSIMTASFVASKQKRSEGDDDDMPIEIKQDDGLHANHTYSVTGITQFYLEGTDELVRLVRLRNPWGGAEYTGPWSDTSEEWNNVSQAKLEELGVTIQDDGEFWIEAEYFLNRFIIVDMCHLEPGSAEEDPDAKHWETAVFEGSWMRGVSAGGSDIRNDKYGTNPQYLITLGEPDSEDPDGICSMLVSLRQKTERVCSEHLDRKGGMWKSIAFAIHKVKDPVSWERPLTIEYLRNSTMVENLGPRESRDVTVRLRLLPATYCVVPYMKEADTECDFLLHVFTEQKSECRECGGGYWSTPQDYGQWSDVQAQEGSQGHLRY